MNRGKKQMTSQQARKMRKEVRNNAEAFQPEEDRAPTTWKILSKFRPRPAKKKEEELLSFEKTVSKKKRKLHSKHSKRTTPGQVEKDITPNPHIHPESQKTLAALSMQSLAKGRRVKVTKSKK